MADVMSVVSGLVGVVVGASITSLREWWQRRKRHRSYWSGLSAEVDLCAGLARAYVNDGVKAPLYRLPTIAYDKAFPALLGDGAVTDEEALVILRFYAQVAQINRGLDYAQSARGHGVSADVLDQEAARLVKKASDLFDPNCRDPGGPYYARVRRAIDRHVKAVDGPRV